MYRMMRVSWECPYENVPKPSCQPNRPIIQAFRLTKLAEAIFTSCTKFDSAIEAEAQRDLSLLSEHCENSTFFRLQHWVLCVLIMWYYTRSWNYCHMTSSRNCAL